MSDRTSDRINGLFAALAHPGVYLAFGVFLVLYNAIGVVFLHSWGGVDYWLHLAVVDAMARNPLHPTNPYATGLSSSHVFTPYHVVWGLIARIASVKAYTLAPVMAAVNLGLFLFGVREMTIQLTRSARLALPFALTLLFLWLRPWDWSGFYNFGLFPVTTAYPYWISLSLALILLGRLGRDEPGGRMLVAYILAVALAFLVHPLTGSFLALMLAIRGVVDAGLSTKARLICVASSCAGLALALAWPYYSVLTVAVGAPRFAERSFMVEWQVFYDKFALRLMPAGLGLVYFGYAVRARRWDWIGWGFLAVSTLYLLNPALMRNVFFSRYVVYVALLLHCGVLRGLSEALGRLTDAASSGTRPDTRVARMLVVVYLVVLSGSALLEVRSSMGWWGAPWALASASPAGDRANREIIRRFERFAPFVGPSDVLMASIDESWVWPGIVGSHVVGIKQGNPFLNDYEARLKAVERFFDHEVTADERRAILTRFGVTRILVPRKEAPLLASLGPEGPRIVYADDYYELRVVGRSGTATPR